jgi:hypothetical protein
LNSHSPIPALIAWTLAGVWWLRLFRSSRRRSRLIGDLAREYSGFVRKRFFLPTLSLEPVDMAWAKICAGEPVRLSIRYELPFTGLSSFPQTIFEFETREALFGQEGGTYSLLDLNAGRGLFLGGANLTEDFRKFCLITPHVRAFRMGWKGSRVWLAVPGLLDSSEEIWVRHCAGFMEEMVSRLIGPETAGKSPS